MKPLLVMVLGVAALALSGCGSNNEQRTATGAGSGALVGGLVGGPIGLAVGAGVGAVGGNQEQNMKNEAQKLENEHSKQTAQAEPTHQTSSKLKKQHTKETPQAEPTHQTSSAPAQ